MTDNRLDTPATHESFHRQFSAVSRYTFAVLLVAAGCSLVIVGVRGASESRLLRQAEIALASRDFASAETWALGVVERDPNSTRARLIAGQSAVMRLQPERALQFFRQIPDDGTLVAVEGLIGRGERCLRVGRAREAEECLRAALYWDQNNRRANRLLGQLLANEGRTWEAMSFARTAIKLGDHKVSELIIAAGVDRLCMAEPGFIDNCTSAMPDDPLPLLCPVKQTTFENRPSEHREWLERVATKHPSLIEVQVVLGRVLLETGTETEFRRWHDHLPKSIEIHPELWAIRGRWARNHGQVRAAVQCYAEALRRRPDDSEACFQLSQLLARLGDTVNASIFAKRAQTISTLNLKLAEASSVATPGSVQPIVAALESLGRNGEAAAWCDLVLDNWPDETWALQAAVRLSRRISTQGLEEPFHLVESIIRLNFPLPNFEEAVSKAQRPSSRSKAAISFSEVARDTGVEFHYFNGADPQAGRAYMFEFSGGGIGVIDFDGDHWPDLYLTQGSRWPSTNPDAQICDRLYRNLGNDRFTDVTEFSGIEEFSFSQGVTVGDFDNDGFPDLYVANIGPNRLFHNQGDGTFREVENAGGAAGNQWTTSCVMADLNGDSLPDIYAVNYLAGPEVFERKCEAESRSVQCGPTLFAAEQDRLYLNRGDGRFDDVTQSAGVVASDGKGLGVVAANLDGSGRLSLFVANDTTPNFLFVNETAPVGSAPRFSERGVLAGLACDEEGQAQASMGIAIDDANGDGLIDMFITNFYRESNVLYIQQPGQVFVDRTRAAGLREPSFLQLGFGTQFLDADLDGWPDLFVTNGHINDFHKLGIPYQMPPQFLRNQSEGKFVELPSNVLGPYFAGKYLGRAAAHLDWNRDGKEDLAVTHVDAPFALLRNDTQLAGHFLKLHFSGVDSARDAIGTVVKISTPDGHSWIRQLTAGGGFEVSNERNISFGLGANTTVVELHVRWPSGASHIFHDLSVDNELVVIEGRPPVAVRLSR